MDQQSMRGSCTGQSRMFIMLTGTKAGTRNDGLRFLSLEADVELESVDMPIELLGRACDLRIGVPLQEARIG